LASATWGDTDFGNSLADKSEISGPSANLLAAPGKRSRCDVVPHAAETTLVHNSLICREHGLLGRHDIGSQRQCRSLETISAARV
jgi:hypothetical protein